MTAKIIAVTNRKGGVGKSTMTAQIAMLLAAQGRRIGVVDTDSQGHAGLIMNMTTGLPEVDNGLHRVLIEGAALSEVLLRVPTDRFRRMDAGDAGGELFLLPSSDRTYKIPFEIDHSKIFALLDEIEDMITNYSLDAVLIDTNPTLNLFDAWVFMAADAYIYVTECEQMAFDGLRTAMQQIASVGQDRKRHLRRETQLLGIIPNKFRASTYIHKRNIQFLAEAFPGNVWPPVSLRTEWVEATELHKPVYQHAPKKQATRDLFQIVQKMQERLGWQTAATS